MNMKIKHIPKHMKLPMRKNTPFSRGMMELKLIQQGYTIPGKYLGGK